MGVAHLQTFFGHIGDKVAPVKTKIGWVLRTFRARERQPMLALWKQLILCGFDYCSQLWNPSKTGDIQALELLQRSYLRCINGMQGLYPISTLPEHLHSTSVSHAETT